MHSLPHTPAQPHLYGLRGRPLGKLQVVACQQTLQPVASEQSHQPQGDLGGDDLTCMLPRHQQQHLVSQHPVLPCVDLCVDIGGGPTPAVLQSSIEDGIALPALGNAPYFLTGPSHPSKEWVCFIDVSPAYPERIDASNAAILDLAAAHLFAGFTPRKVGDGHHRKAGLGVWVRNILKSAGRAPLEL